MRGLLALAGLPGCALDRTHWAMVCDAHGWQTVWRSWPWYGDNRGMRRALHPTQAAIHIGPLCARGVHERRMRMQDRDPEPLLRPAAGFCARDLCKQLSALAGIWPGGVLEWRLLPVAACTVWMPVMFGCTVWMPCTVAACTLAALGCTRQAVVFGMIIG